MFQECMSKTNYVYRKCGSNKYFEQQKYFGLKTYFGPKHFLDKQVIGAKTNIIGKQIFGSTKCFRSNNSQGEKKFGLQISWDPNKCKSKNKLGYKQIYE